MKTTLYVYYRTSKYMEGMKFFNCDMSAIKELIPLGQIEIDNPFEAPNQSVINNAHIEMINAEIKEHKAQINLLENKVKDFLCVENKEAIEA